MLASMASSQSTAVLSLRGAGAAAEPGACAGMAGWRSSADACTYVPASNCDTTSLLRGE